MIEPGIGGRLFERTPEGEEIPWGEVTLWEPPHRLGDRGATWRARNERGWSTLIPHYEEVARA